MPRSPPRRRSSYLPDAKPPRLEAHSFPQDREFKGENKGYGIERQYEKLLPDGSTAEANDLRVGDMVVISLNIEIGGGDRYLAINDPLPSVLEAINPEFGTQNEREGDQLPEGIEAWFCDHREVRADRALFFTDYAPQKGKFQLRYLARVIAEGDTIAPPARIEAMYQPENTASLPLNISAPCQAAAVRWLGSEQLCMCAMSKLLRATSKDKAIVLIGGRPTVGSLSRPVCRTCAGNMLFLVSTAQAHWHSFLCR